MLNKIVKLISIVSSIYIASANSKAVAMDNNIESFFYNKASEISKLKKDTFNIELFVNQGYAQISNLSVSGNKTSSQSSSLVTRQNGVAICLFLVFKKIYNLNEAELKIAISSLYADYKNIDNYSILYNEHYSIESGNNSLHFNCIINLDAIDSILINDLKKDSLSIKKILPQQIKSQKPDVKKNTTKGMAKIQSLKGLRLVLGIYQVGELERVEGVLKQLQIDYAFAGYAKDNYFVKSKQLSLNQFNTDEAAEAINIKTIDTGVVKIANNTSFDFEDEIDQKYGINLIKTDNSKNVKNSPSDGFNNMQNSIKYAILYIKDKRSIDDLNALLSVQNLYINLNNQTNTLVIS